MQSTAMREATPLLALLRRLEAQNIWRMGYSMFPSSGQDAGLSAAAAAVVQHEQAHAAALHATTAAQEHVQAAHYSTIPSAAALLQQQLQQQPQPPRPQPIQPLQQEQQQLEWFDDASIDAQQALRLLVHRIQQEGPVKQRHLQKLYQRCRTADELDKALKLTRLNYLARGELQQHKPFSHKTSQTLVHQALSVGAPEVAQHALQHADMFGLSRDSHKEFHPLLIYYSKQGQLDKMFEAYQFMQSHGKRPGPETCYILVKGCVDQGRPDLAELLIQEFEANGVRIREGTKLYLQQNAAAAFRGSAAAQAGFAAA